MIFEVFEGGDGGGRGNGCGIEEVVDVVMMMVDDDV